MVVSASFHSVNGFTSSVVLSLTFGNANTDLRFCLAFQVWFGLVWSDPGHFASILFDFICFELIRSDLAPSDMVRLASYFVGAGHAYSNSTFLSLISPAVAKTQLFM